MTRDTWHVKYDTWHVTYDTWHMKHRGRWPFSQKISYNFGGKVFWIFGGKGWLADWTNEWMNNKGVCRTAPATRGLLIILEYLNWLLSNLCLNIYEEGNNLINLQSDIVIRQLIFISTRRYCLLWKAFSSSCGTISQMRLKFDLIFCAIRECLAIIYFETSWEKRRKRNNDKKPSTCVNCLFQCFLTVC